MGLVSFLDAIICLAYPGLELVFHIADFLKGPSGSNRGIKVQLIGTLGIYASEPTKIQLDCAHEV